MSQTRWPVQRSRTRSIVNGGVVSGCWSSATAEWSAVVGQARRRNGQGCWSSATAEWSAARPGAGHALDPLKKPRGGHAEEAEGHDPREDVLGFQELEGFPEQEAQPGLGSLDLGDEH